jgi:hypothetical protein
MRTRSSTVPVKIAASAAFLGLALVACNSAWWAYRLAVLVIFNFLHDREQGHVNLDQLVPVFLIGAILAFVICCRFGWLLFKFLSNSVPAIQNKRWQLPL